MKTLREDGSEVQAGDVVRDFHGFDYVFVRATRARGTGHTGKVLVGDSADHGQREFYDTVFDLRVLDDAPPASAIGEVNPHTGHTVIDQIGNVVLAWRTRKGGPDREYHAEYATWSLFVTHDNLRGFDAGDYFEGPGALVRATASLLRRSGQSLAE